MAMGNGHLPTADVTNLASGNEPTPLGVAASSPRQRRALSTLAIVTIIRYNGHLYCRATALPDAMTEEANHGQISQYR